jgi:hypothetical protein
LSTDKQQAPEEATNMVDMVDVDFITAYEAGETDEQETIEGFQRLIDSGIVWQLQGSYGRMAMALIDAGYCFIPGRQPKSSDEVSHV